MKMKPERRCSLDVPKDPFEHRTVTLHGRMHVQTYLLNGVRYIGPSQCQVLQCTGHASVPGRLLHGHAVAAGALDLGVGRGGCWLAVGHPGAFQNVESVGGL